MDLSCLSIGAIKDFLDGHGPPHPKLQVLSFKKLVSEGSSSVTDRYKLQLSDGRNYQPGMLATQMNHLITSGELDKFCVIQVERMTCNVVSGRKIIILVSFSVLHRGIAVGGKLGEPKALDVMVVNQNGGQQNQQQPKPVQPQQQFNRPTPSFPLAPAQNFGGGGGAPGGPGRSGGFYGSSRSSSSSPGGGFAVKPSPGLSSPGGTKCISPISTLNPYQNRWTIRARVTSKPSLRHYSNSRGEGRVMSVELVDESGEIKATAFNETADQFMPVLEANKVYYISRARLKPANRAYSSCKNDYEMTLSQDTVINECFEDVDSIPSISYSFVSIANLENARKDTVIDVIGVCKSANDISSIITRTSRKVSKRDVILVDTSGTTVSCTFWGSDAEGFDPTGNPVVAIKGAKVSDFNGVSLSVLNSSVVNINPDIKEAHLLRGWYDSTGKNQEVNSISNQGSFGGSFVNSFLTLKQVRNLDLGKKEKPDYFSIAATVCYFKRDNMLYKACPTQECNKKVNEDSTGTYFCEKCNQSYPNFKYRIILQVNVADFSHNCWLSCFNEVGCILLGTDSQKLGDMKDQDENRFDMICEEANFKDYIFRVRAKIDTYNDEQRLRVTCSNATLINYAQEAKRRMEDIKKLLAT